MLNKQSVLIDLFQSYLNTGFICLEIMFYTLFSFVENIRLGTHVLTF